MTKYLKKSALFPAQIFGAPHPDLQLVVVIPAYRELSLIESLEALSDCEMPDGAVEVIVVLNDSASDTKQVKKENEAMYQQACTWGLANSTARRKFHVLYHSNLPAKHAGVGLARKIGLDEAVYRLEQVGHPAGMLSCYDADTKCDKNYLVAIEKHFTSHPKLQGCSIYFEHPLEGKDFKKEVYQAIIQYELHLRYYVHAQRFTGFPFAFQTIGSSMVVRANAYQQQGGMNKRKAGEDFYFLHKFIPLGQFDELRTTRVIPSPRISERVPFGTGRAVGQLVSSEEGLTTYAPQSFVDLKELFEFIPSWYKRKTTLIKKDIEQLSPAVQDFLKLIVFTKRLEEIRENTTTQPRFENRFFRWFNAFMVMKYVHFCRDNFYENVTVLEAGEWLLGALEGEAAWVDSLEVELLERFREIDRG